MRSRNKFYKSYYKGKKTPHTKEIVLWYHNLSTIVSNSKYTYGFILINMLKRKRIVKKILDILTSSQSV